MNIIRLFSLLSVILTLALSAAHGQVVEKWVQRYNGPANGNDNATSISSDSTGNVVVTGYSSNASGNTDYYTAKYAAASGALLWEKRYNGPANLNDKPSSVMVDSAGNVAVTGYSFDASGHNDYYTAKYAAADGALLWENRYHGPGNGDNAQALAMDAVGNVVVTGYSNNGSSDDYYTVKYAAADGALLWEKRYNGPANLDDRAYSVATDSVGNVVVTGASFNAGYTDDDCYTAKYAAADGSLLWEKRYNGPANSYDEGISVLFDGLGNVVVSGVSSNGSNFDYYTAKYRSSDGVQLWEHRHDGPDHSDDAAQRAAVDNAGNVVVTGYSRNANDADYYTAKYGAIDGALLWEQRYNGPGNSNDYANSTTTDSAGNVVVTGKSINANGNNDYYTVKYAAANGALIWEQRYNGPANREEGMSVSPATICLTLTPDGGAVVTGSSNNGTNNDYATVSYGPVISTPEIAVEQPVTNNLTDGVGILDFGGLKVGNDVTRVFTVKNTGTATLTGIAVTLTGANAGTDFGVTVAPPASLAPGGSTTFNITFIPAALGTRTATIQVASNDADENPFDIAITGAGLTSSQDWRQIYFGTTANSGNAAYTADPDGDGIKNIVEYALGGNPTSSTSGANLLPAGNINLTAHCMQFSLTHYLDRNDITLTVQAADSLSGPWTNLSRSVNGAAFTVLTAGTVISETGSGPTRAVTVCDIYQTTDIAHPRRFMRLEVSQ